MASKITIEALSNASGMGVVMEILAQPTIAMVALGSLACVTSIQHRAETMSTDWQAEQGLTPKQRLLAQGLSAREYGLGKNSRIAAQLLQQAANLSGIKGVIIYCSCLDVLTGWDEKSVLKQVIIPVDVKIAFLYRGPLVKRRLLPKIALGQIWQQWGYEPIEFKASKVKAEAFSTTEKTSPIDFKQAILDNKGEEAIILLSPGGCASCLYDLPINKQSRVYNTRFDDLALSNLQPLAFVKAIEAAFPPTTKLLLLGSAIIKTVGLDMEAVSNQLQQDGYISNYLPTDGFRK